MSLRLCCRRRPARLGLSLIEVMIALAISVMLLTAVTVAFSSASDAVEANDEFFRAAQLGRVSLNHLLTEIRRGAVDETWSANQLHVITAAGDDWTYRYDDATDRLLLVTNDSTTDADHVLARNVTAFAFDVEIGEDYNKAPCVARVSVVLTVERGSHKVLLSGSACPRRNMRY